MSIQEDQAGTYRNTLFPLLEGVASRIADHLKEHADGISRIDSIRARAKDPDRFLTKALKEDDEGNIKYADPLSEIQDQVGARITVFYLNDVDVVRQRILEYYRPIEILEKEPVGESEFGYFGVHFILKIPDEALPEVEENINLPEFFELQVKTLFQHAWSEAHHDLGYKSVRDLTREEKRKVAFSAAQAWGADKVFQELFNEISAENDN